MKTLYRLAGIVSIITVFGFLLSSFDDRSGGTNAAKFPYQQAGLTREQAAAHLLSRFTYGAQPGQVKEVAAMGLENWFRQQLKADQKDDSLAVMLDKYDLLKMSNAEIVNTIPRGGAIGRLAVRDGFLSKDSLGSGSKEYREAIRTYMSVKGFRPAQEMIQQFTDQKILRAAYSQNQLQEVLTEFWFNHFNVSFTKNECTQYIPSYERDVIRPNALSSFETLLVATAQSPAMLVFLDNSSSTGDPDSIMRTNPVKPGAVNKPKKKGAGGLNENYAREIMELHTLGVDGGYTQQDVTQAARVLTGWTVFPIDTLLGPNNFRNSLETMGEEKMDQRGFVHIGDFLFVPSRHDSRPKMVLGNRFDSGGYNEGRQLLHMLATRDATARFICTKLAIRFVSDTPPESLIKKMAATFQQKKGDIKQVLITMVSAPEFWSADALREKTKSPFELAISSVRALNARIGQPNQLYTWINRMGQRLYYYQAPTGFPDKGEYWINTGSLLSRMNFGLALASQRIPGISFDLLALNNNHEPESTQAALATYSGLLIPGRDLSGTIKQLTPLLNDPKLQQKVETAAGKMPVSPAGKGNRTDMKQASDTSNLPPLAKNSVVTASTSVRNFLPQVTGIIIGSPEFQRK